MQRFHASAPLDLSTYAEPPLEDRSGPALTRGFMFVMLGTVASEHMSPEMLKALEEINPEAWYQGQLLETIVNALEKRDPELPYSVGRAINFLMVKELARLGVTSPEVLFQSLSVIWKNGVRGDAGDMRARIVGPRRAHVELEQPYNCRLESGGLHGLLEGFDITDVRVAHTQCMRDGAPFCVLDVSWQE